MKFILVCYVSHAKHEVNYTSPSEEFFYTRPHACAVELAVRQQIILINVYTYNNLI